MRVIGNLYSHTNSVVCGLNFIQTLETEQVEIEQLPNTYRVKREYRKAVLKLKFSEREGIIKARTEIQIDNIDAELRAKLWNVLDLHYWRIANDYATPFKNFPIYQVL